MYSVLDLIKQQVKNSRDLFEGTVGDLQEEHIHKDPGGKALPIAAVYAHLVLSEDMSVQTFLQGGIPLSESEWKGKTGISLPAPEMDANWSEENAKWAKEVRVDLKLLKEYSKAVYQATDDYINNLQEEDLEKEIDLGSWGKMKLPEFLTGFIIGHSFSLAGEISALKGIQGAKGYPF